jgi:hypothetical protein
MSGHGRPQTLDEQWAGYCRDRAAGGSVDPEKDWHIKDAWLAGAAAMAVRTQAVGVDAAWDDFLRNLRAEACSDLGPAIGLPRLPIDWPAGYGAT